MGKGTNLTNHFLIAMPGLQDPNFSQTVTYVCEHTDEGTMGIVVNRPLDLTLGDVFKQMSIPGGTEETKQRPVFSGGPVAPERGFVLHTPHKPWHSTLRITDGISITTSRDILEAMAEGQGPAATLVALGYAGWAGGQLEAEIVQNSWLSGPADPDILFDLAPAERWKAAAAAMGIDIGLLASEAGHA
jgi:putative transcriptional regulator